MISNFVLIKSRKWKKYIKTDIHFSREYCVLPRRTKEGYIVILHRLVDPYPPEYQMDVAMKILIMTMDSALYKDPPTGIYVKKLRKLIASIIIARLQPTSNSKKTFFQAWYRSSTWTKLDWGTWLGLNFGLSRSSCCTSKKACRCNSRPSMSLTAFGSWIKSWR